MQVSDDSDGVHKCDHTRGVDTKQLDDGIDHTFVSTGEGETLCPSLRFPLENRYQSTMDSTRGVAHPSLGIDAGSHCRGVR